MVTASKVVRTGISVPQELIRELDAFVGSTSYSNRSEVIRDAVRSMLHEHKALQVRSGERVGAVMAVFDLHEEGASDLLHRVQHEYSDVVSTVTHVHLVDLRNCLELLIVRGGAGRVNELINHMVGSKGVKEIKSIML